MNPQRGSSGRVPGRNKHSPPSGSHSPAASRTSRSPRRTASYRPRVPGRCPESTSALLHPVAESLGVHASRWPTRAIEPRAFPVSARSSNTIATARSRSSAECGFRDAMSPNFPRGHGLQGTSSSRLPCRSGSTGSSQSSGRPPWHGKHRPQAAGVSTALSASRNSAAARPSSS